MRSARERFGGRRATVVELIGPAGAGKSAVAHALARCHPRARAGFSLWGLPRRLLAASAPALLVPMLNAARGGSPLHRAELAQMLRMGALRRVVRRAVSGGHVLLLDEGPIFGLTWLDVFFGRNRDHGWAEWRREAIAEWASLLDAVVWLDAADAVLAGRIRARTKPHPLKNRPDGEIYGFTALFRRAFGRVIADLEATRTLKIYFVRSDDRPADNLAVRLRAALPPLRADS